MNEISKGYCAIRTVALLGKSVIRMILRHVTYADIPTLSRYAQGCGNMPVEELRAMIDAFDAPCMDGKYFEMFAVEDDDQNMVGTVSLFQHTKDVVSAGPEIFAPYRGRGLATEALNRVYALARAKG